MRKVQRRALEAHADTVTETTRSGSPTQRSSSVPANGDPHTVRRGRPRHERRGAVDAVGRRDPRGGERRAADAAAAAAADADAAANAANADADACDGQRGARQGVER